MTYPGERCLMAHMLPDTEVTVHLETADGLVFIGTAKAASISVEQSQVETTGLGDGLRDYTVGFTSWEVELQGIGTPLWMGSRERAIDAVRSSLEWVCPWCGAVMPRERGQCTQCGGWRSFVYELAENTDGG